tara:strand:- start:451 stop:1251 length:801 start_codon:yes stop_codon:yes gene_type:complete
MNSLAKILSFSSSLFLLIFFFSWAFSQPSFSLRHLIIDVKASDTRHVQSEDLKRLVLQKLNGSALTSDLSPVYESIVSHPWVKEATIRRIWPDTILISLIEHNIIGVWSDGRFITEEGILLQFNEFDRLAITNEKNCKLMKLGGPPGTVESVLAKARMISKKAKSIGLQPVGLQLTSQFDWKVNFSNGMKMELGGDKLPTPLDERLNNFFNSLDWFRQNINKELAYVDLRYAQGFAYKELNKKNYKQSKPTLKNCFEKNDNQEVIL